VNLQAAEGTEVRAVAPGQAVLVDWYPGYGQFVLLRHPGGFYTLYGHLSAVAVNVDDIRAESAVIGRVGSTGRIDGKPQLHFEIMEGEEPLDPAVWLRE
jgi:murein DD-endopeptidase MepM/ murein hydrolase activator NlpD